VLDPVPGQPGGQVDERHVGLLLDLQQLRGEVVSFFGQWAPRIAAQLTDSLRARLSGKS
jgi:hypothetical protein